MLMSKPGISLALPGSMRRESVSEQHTLGSNVLHLDVIFRETQQHPLQSGWSQANWLLKDRLKGLVVRVHGDFPPKCVCVQIFTSK